MPYLKRMAFVFYHILKIFDEACNCNGMFIEVSEHTFLNTLHD